MTGRRYRDTYAEDGDDRDDRETPGLGRRRKHLVVDTPSVDHLREMDHTPLAPKKMCGFWAALRLLDVPLG